MTTELMRAATLLSEALARENTALAAVDFVAAAALLDAKREAAGRFAAAHARLAATGRPGGPPPRDVADIARRLRDLAAENKKLLERAIAAQRRVIGSIARAAPRAMARSPRYDAKGALADNRSPSPVALSARA
jgi:hypothetical protein